MWDSNIYGSTDAYAGPQSDGSVLQPVTIAQPVDAGGGAPGIYPSWVTDVFKFGVGVVAQDRARQDMLDYRRWEATSQGLTQQGYASQQAQQRNSNGLLLIGFMVIGALLLTRS